MEPWVAALVLVAALLHAGWHTLIKLDGDALVMTAAIALGAAAVALVAMPFVAIPAAQSWPYILASVAIHQGYFLFLLNAYRLGDLSQVYPIARGTAPLLVLGAAWALAGERVGIGGTAAVILVALGIASLAWRGDRARLGHSRAIVYALGTAVCIAAYTVVDGIGARLAGSPHSYSVWLFVLDAIPIAVIAVARRGRAAFVTLRRNGLAALGGGAMQLLAYGLVIWALTLAPMALVAALRETSVVFAALLGALVLKEPFGPRRIVAVSLVCTGVVLLRLV